jgi:hypothetical protein
MLHKPTDKSTECMACVNGKIFITPNTTRSYLSNPSSWFEAKKEKKKK